MALIDCWVTCSSPAFLTNFKYRRLEGIRFCHVGLLPQERTYETEQEV